MEAVFMMDPPLFLEVKSKENFMCKPKFEISYLNLAIIEHETSFVLFSADVSMHGHMIVYDNVKRRIGWMKSDCVRPRDSDFNVPSFQG